MGITQYAVGVPRTLHGTRMPSWEGALHNEHHTVCSTGERTLYHTGSSMWEE